MEPNLNSPQGENAQVRSLPKFDAQTPVSLAPRYPYAGVTALTIALTLVAVIATTIILLVPNTDITPIQGYLKWLALPIVGLYVLVWLSAKYKAYSVREQDVSFYSGILFRRVVIQPITRLQHIEVSRGALERAFGLATLKLYSAGGAMHSVAIPGLLADDAEALRGYILDSRGLTDEQ